MITFAVFFSTNNHMGCHTESIATSWIDITDIFFVHNFRGTQWLRL